MSDEEFDRLVADTKEAILLELEEMVYEVEKKLQQVEAKFQELKRLLPYIITCRGHYVDAIQLESGKYEEEKEA